MDPKWHKLRSRQKTQPVSNSLSTSGTKDILPLQGAPLEPHQATQFRAQVARGIYLAQDRTDIAYAVKELSRSMATPTTNDMENLRKLARYLIGAPRVVNHYKYQTPVHTIHAWSDTD